MVMTVNHRPHRLLLDTESSASSSPNGSAGTRGSYANEVNFDTNMVIILAALLCALICALGLNSIVRCVFRCSRRFSSEEGNQTEGRFSAAAGIKKRALRRIPVAAYNSGLGIKATECLICLGEFSEGEKVRVLPKCNHGFHVRCVDTWLLSHSSCPTCRQPLLLMQNSGSSSESADAAAGVRRDRDYPVAGDVSMVNIDEVG